MKKILLKCEMSEAFLLKIRTGQGCPPLALPFILCIQSNKTHQQPKNWKEQNCHYCRCYDCLHRNHADSTGKSQEIITAPNSVG